MQRASGELKQGGKIEVHLKFLEGPAMTLKPTLTKVDEHRELRWLGHLFVPGLFDGEHIFRIEPLAPDRVRFVQREVFIGLLVPPMLGMIGEKTHRGFVAMNEALKAEAENNWPCAAVLVQHSP